VFLAVGCLCAWLLFSIQAWRGHERVEAAGGHSIAAFAVPAASAMPVVFSGFPSVDTRKDDGASGIQEPHASLRVSAWLLWIFLVRRGHRSTELFLPCLLFRLRVLPLLPWRPGARRWRCRGAEVLWTCCFPVAFVGYLCASGLLRFVESGQASWRTTPRRRRCRGARLGVFLRGLGCWWRGLWVAAMQAERSIWFRCLPSWKWRGGICASLLDG
jgi:hypothetical protein